MEFLRAEAAEAAEQFSDRKHVWIVDKDEGFVRASIVSDNGDTLKVNKSGSMEVM